jgi:hypothetical protein
MSNYMNIHVCVKFGKGLLYGFLKRYEETVISQGRPDRKIICDSL